MNPHLILSDIHAHNWSLFAKHGPGGVNSRLQIILDEIERACDALLAAGGRAAHVAGDIFHVRGSLDPEVLNPTQDCFRRQMDKGVEFYAIPGNHDLKGVNTTRLGNGIQTLGETFSQLGFMRVYNEVNGPVEIDGALFAYVPWFNDTADLLRQLETLSKLPEAGAMRVFIHAGIDDVLPNMPDHGLDAKTLEDFGFGYVFAGHYHNHRFVAPRVVSIGATTHQTWGDIGSKAGFMMLTGDDAKFHRSHAPEFIDVSSMSEDDMKLAVDGNYARFRGPQMSDDEIKELKRFLTYHGALGVSIQVPRLAAAAPRANAPTAAMTLDQSVGHFIDNATDIPTHVSKAEVKKQAADVLTEARAVHEEA